MFCEKCNDYIYKGNVCLCEKYLIDYEDDKTEIFSISFEDAAEKWAQNYNVNGDYCLMDSVINIIISKNGETKKFRVGAEQDINYTIEEYS